MTDRVPTIAAFVMTDGNGFGIDTTEMPLAVFVSPNQGNIDLHPSLSGTDSTVHEAIVGSRVHGFEVAKSEGSDGLFLSYTSDEPRYRLLGFVSDVDSAHAWVQRVNQLYVSNDAAAPLPSPFANSTVINDILRTRDIRVMPGDYLNSRIDMDSIPPYHPEWQQQYVSLVVKHFRDRTGYTGPLTGCDLHEWLSPPAHRYRYLISRINYGRKNFDNRITLPLELIFDDDDRTDEIGIIPLGAATSVAVLYARNGLAKEARSVISSGPSSLRDFLSKFRTATRGLSRFALCSMTETAADYLLDDFVADNDLSFDQKDSMPTIDSLSQWLAEFQESGFLLLDIGVAYQVRRRLLNKYRINTTMSRLPYPRSVPVGLAYRKDDPEWGVICHRALRDTFQPSSPAAKKSIAQARSDAQSVDINLAVAGAASD
jgi:hypothetical protein